MACKLKPNIIIFGGYMIDNKKVLKDYETFLSEISKCSNKIVAIFGNWERKEGLITKLKHMYKKYNIILLENDYIKLNFGMNVEYYSLLGNLKDKLKRDCKRIIVVAHYPASLKMISKKEMGNICLELAGHTHGG